LNEEAPLGKRDGFTDRICYLSGSVCLQIMHMQINTVTQSVNLHPLHLRNVETCMTFKFKIS